MKIQNNFNAQDYLEANNQIFAEVFSSLSDVDKKHLNKFYHKIFNSKEYEYNDNFRICKIGDSKSEDAYNKAQKNGCCGFFDETMVLPSKTKIKIGFNYGH